MGDQFPSVGEGGEDGLGCGPGSGRELGKWLQHWRHRRRGGAGQGWQRPSAEGCWLSAGRWRWSPLQAWMPTVGPRPGRQDGGRGALRASMPRPTREGHPVRQGHRRCWRRGAGFVLPAGLVSEGVGQAELGGAHRRGGVAVAGGDAGWEGVGFGDAPLRGVGAGRRFAGRRVGPWGRAALSLFQLDWMALRLQWPSGDLGCGADNLDGAVLHGMELPAVDCSVVDIAVAVGNLASPGLQGERWWAVKRSGHWGGSGQPANVGLIR